MTRLAPISDLWALVPKGRVARGGLVTAALRLLAMPCVLLLQFGLVRLLGAGGYGEFIYVYTWYMSLLPLSALGLHEATVRFIAEYRLAGNAAAFGGFMRWSATVTVGGAVAVAAIASAATWIIQPRLTATLFWALLLGWACIPLGSLASLASAVLRGTERFAAALVPVRIVQPLLIVGLTYLLVGALGWPTDAVTAMAGMFVGLVIVLVTTSWLSVSMARGETMRATPQYRTAEWRDAALHFLGLTIIPLFGRIDVIMLGMLQSTREAGVYATAIQLYTLAGFGFYTLDYVIAPRIASLNAEGKRTSIQRLVAASTLASTVATLPLAIALIAAGRWVLTLFDPQFASGYLPLVILASAQLFSVTFGPIGRLLTMTGNHQIAFRLSAAATVMNVVLNLLLIPAYGMVGAALATATALVLRNIVGLALVVRATGVNPSLVATVARFR